MKDDVQSLSHSKWRCKYPGDNLWQWCFAFLPILRSSHNPSRRNGWKSVFPFSATHLSGVLPWFCFLLTFCCFLSFVFDENRHRDSFPEKGKAVSAATTISRNHREKRRFSQTEGLGNRNPQQDGQTAKTGNGVFACRRRILRYNSRSPHLPHS